MLPPLLPPPPSRIEKEHCGKSFVFLSYSLQRQTKVPKQPSVWGPAAAYPSVSERTDPHMLARPPVLWSLHIPDRPVHGTAVSPPHIPGALVVTRTGVYPHVKRWSPRPKVPDVLTAQPPGRAAPVPVRLSWAPSRLNTARSPETLGPRFTLVLPLGPHPKILIYLTFDGAVVN